MRLFKYIVGAYQQNVHCHQHQKGAEYNVKCGGATNVVWFNYRSSKQPCKIDIEKHEGERRMIGFQLIVIHGNIAEIQYDKITEDIDPLYVL